MNIASLKILTLLMVAMALFGCASIVGTETNHYPWNDSKIYRGEGGSVTEVEGVELWKHGSPELPHKIIGLIQQTRSSDSFNKMLFGKFNQQEIISIVKSYNGDGVISVKKEKYLSGYSVSSGYGPTSIEANYEDSEVLAIYKYIVGK